MAGTVPDDFWVEWHPTRSILLDVADPEWVRIGSSIRDLFCAHGYERNFGRAEAGPAQVTFDNRDRQWDPTNRQSPNWPNVGPRRHMRIRAQVGATVITLYRGFITGWLPDWSINDGWVTMNAVDSLAALAAVINTTTFETQVQATAPDLWLPLTDGGGATAQPGPGTLVTGAHTRVDGSGPDVMPYGGTQSSTSYPYNTSGSGSFTDLLTAIYGGYGLASEFTIAAVFKTQSTDAQCIWALGQVDAAQTPLGDVALTVDPVGTYSFRVGNNAGNTLLTYGLPHNNTSSLVFGRYSAPLKKMDLDVNLGTITYGGGPQTYPTMFAPRAGFARVGNSLDAGNSNPFKGQLMHALLWQRWISDDDLNSIFRGFFGNAARQAFIGTSATAPQSLNEVANWVLDRYGIALSRRVLPAAPVGLPPWATNTYFGGLHVGAAGLDMLARVANTEGGLFYADRAGNYILTLSGSVGTVRGTYDTNPPARPPTQVLTETQSTFETGVDAVFWTTIGATLSTNAEGPQSLAGAKTLKCTATAAAFGLQGGPIAVQPGDVVELRARAKYTGAGNFAAYIDLFDSGGGFVSFVSTALSAPGADGWRVATVVATIPNGIAFVNVYPCYSNGGSAVGDVSYVDAVQVDAPMVSVARGLHDITFANDDRTFYTSAELLVATPGGQTVKYRHPNADQYGEVPYKPDSMFYSAARAAAAAPGRVGAAAPKLDVLDAEVVLGGPGVDPLEVLSMDVSDQVTAIGRVPDTTVGPFMAWSAGAGWGADAVIMDTFTRADSAVTIGSTERGVQAYTVVSGTWGVSAGTGYKIGGDATHQQVSLDTGSNDHQVSIIVASGAGNVGVAARFIDANNFYVLQTNPAVPGSTTLFRNVAGVSTSLATAAAAAQPGDRLTLQVVGSHVQGWVNSTLVFDVVDTSLPTATKVAVDVYNTSARFDGLVARAATEPATTRGWGGPPPITQGSTVMRVEHRYERAHTWKTKMFLKPS